MPKPTLADKLVVAISSRALFDLTESHRIYTEEGVDAYHRYQVEHENEILAPGPAFALAKKLLRLNRPDKQYVEVILLSRNSADTGLRVFNAIKHYGLDITRAAFTKGEATSRYVPAFGAHLFLSADTGDVKRALADGYAAATIVAERRRARRDATTCASPSTATRCCSPTRPSASTRNRGSSRSRRARPMPRGVPLSGGPFKEFLAALHRIQADFPEDRSPIRTALVTARSAPAHERVIRTLRAWNIRIDEAFFLGGLDKGDVLRAFGADIFFDDQRTHVDSAARHGAAGHVPHGVANERLTAPAHVAAAGATRVSVPRSARWRTGGAASPSSTRPSAPARTAMPQAAALRFRAGRERLCREHAESPIAPERRRDWPGLAWFPHDPAWRVTATFERLAPLHGVRHRAGRRRRPALRARRPRSFRAARRAGDARACIGWKATAAACGCRSPTRRPAARPTAADAISTTRSRAPTSAAAPTASCWTSTSRTTRRARTTSAGRARCRRRRTGCRSR